ncbi:alpha/beta hydrolase [Bacillus pseudomycoides]|uniref:alpha/beta fold hydrolase n=1 Tax=Bacillus pseudomycoides TaxID=64104 RepID=UPI000BED11A8|nr:alpha/beta hydrolase [Bacillus pseudomycoides]PEE05088.1 alpha/beta hydrolase [Bacillus pseudomycoides]PEM80321.1 alpha/beta hydrolase [Bacillus pseudomycoides]PHC85907.1 alpha/beta hydrolase [Bacillus pseudomycoides]
MFKSKKRIALFIVSIVLVASAMYQAICVNNYTEVPGKIIEVNNHDMHIFATGKREDKPVIVMTAGSGTTTPYADFYPLYNKLEKENRVVVYERPGYGYSEKTERSRDIDTVVSELHALLIESDEKPPFILVGHSMGALESIRYAQLYPNEIEGLVFIDGISPEYAQNFEMDIGMKVSWHTMNTAKNIGILRTLSLFGIMDNVFIDIPNLPKELQELKISMALKNTNNRNMKEELEWMSRNGKKVIEQGDLGTLPVLQFSATNNGYENWEKTQNELLKISSRTEQIIFPNTKHYIHHEKAHEINERIKSWIGELQ